MGMSDELVAAAADGSGPQRVLTRGKAKRSAPRFSPDGRWIAFMEMTGTRTMDLWKVPAAGGEPRQVTRSMGRIDPRHLSAGEEVTYRGPDNLAIPTMLFQPWGFREGPAVPGDRAAARPPGAVETTPSIPWTSTSWSAAS